MVGINSLWPLFGISNQLLATVALCVGTTVIVKAGKRGLPGSPSSRSLWLLTVTFTASWQKVFSPDPKLGFLSLADRTMAKVNAGEMAAELGRQVAFNARLDAALTAMFVAVTLIVVVVSVREWMLVIRGPETGPGGGDALRGDGLCRITRNSRLTTHDCNSCRHRLARIIRGITGMPDYRAYLEHLQSLSPRARAPGRARVLRRIPPGPVRRRPQPVLLMPSPLSRTLLRSFLNGLIVLGPVALTIYICVLAFRLSTDGCTSRFPASGSSSRWRW